MTRMTGLQELDEAEKTRPPSHLSAQVSVLRYPTPHELYAAMPQIRNLTQLRPREDEVSLDYLLRLQASVTPEEAVTFAAFAALPRVAVWWGYECLRNLRADFSPHDRELLEKIAHWSSNGDQALRYDIMRMALFAERRTAAVMLGLAAGWSGAQIAPNDPAPVPPHRTPRAVNAAVLSALAQCQLANRPHHLLRVTRLAEQLFRAY
jgi:hypothetical protein